MAEAFQILLIRFVQQGCEPSHQNDTQESNYIRSKPDAFSNHQKENVKLCIHWKTVISKVYKAKQTSANMTMAGAVSPLSALASISAMVQMVSTKTTTTMKFEMVAPLRNGVGKDSKLLQHVTWGSRGCRGRTWHEEVERCQHEGVQELAFNSSRWNWWSYKIWGFANHSGRGNHRSTYIYCHNRMLSLQSGRVQTFWASWHPSSTARKKMKKHVWIPWPRSFVSPRGCRQKR